MCAVRPLTIAIAWLCATAAAVGVAWFGVRTVMQDTALPLPQVSVPISVTNPDPPAPPVTSAGTTTTVPPSTTIPATTAPRGTSSKTAGSTTTTTTTSGNVQRYTMAGGQVVLDLGPSSATLVSATPANGYAVQDWLENGWLRVDFSSGNHTSTLIATWNGHPPSVQTYETG
jgi:hypothetical protein